MDPQALRIEIRPNCSLTVRGARAFFFGACIAPFGVGGFLAFKGFWPILPFAGLEMVVLAWALKASLERRFHSQTIIVSEGEVSIESRERERCARVVFPRHWAQVKLRRADSSLHPSRLTIESHGRQCELGSFPHRRGAAGTGAAPEASHRPCQ